VKRLALALLLGSATLAHAQGPLPLEGFARGIEGRPPGVQKDAPRLVVAFLFDQWRGDLLERYRPAFGKDGFVRALDGGAVFSDCTIPYASTYTGPGHATWLSGAPPSVHGIVNNEWYDRGLKREVACVWDPRYVSVGVPGGGESASPRFMRAQTVADVLEITTMGRGRVVGVSDKARGAVLPAGRRPDGAYWMDESTGMYQTSTYYRANAPAWLDSLNARRAQRIRQAQGTAWTQRASLPTTVWGGTVADPEDTFPHPLIMPKDAPGVTGEQPKNVAPYVTITRHPLALEGAFDLANAAIEGEDMGTDDVPDLLIVSVSVTDRVGHIFGPDSPEALDLASRADSLIAAFMHHLDERVGKGEWAITITADHGVTPNKGLARRFEAAPFDSVGDMSSQKVKDWVDQQLNGKDVTLSVNDGQIVFDPAKLKALNLTRDEAARAVADSAYQSPWFSGGFTADEMRLGSASNPILARAALGWYPGRGGDAWVVPANNVFFEDSPRYRAGHGTAAREQRLVPFVLYGEGVKPGVYREPISTLDIAPTTARLLGIEPPAQCEGVARYEALR
jgi:hypothetical protein